MRQIEMDTWAFVRLMVVLEDSDTSDGLFAAWRHEWQEVDEQLAHLSQNDFEAYSEMMMATQIELDLAQNHAAEYADTMKALITAMKSERSKAKDAEFRKDLDFEIKGLSSLLNA